MVISRYLFILFLVFLLSGCATTGIFVNDTASSLDKPATELAESQLLDVWIEIFDPGELPTDEDVSRGLSMDIRDAEARYIPIQLRNTMEKSGHWGSVRVVPKATEGSEMLVKGRIISSDGGVLQLQITASDASGRQWFQREYGLAVDAQAYESPANKSQSQQPDVFQGLYNIIANDLARYRNGLEADDVTAVRRIAKMRFANDLAPDVFARYLQQDGRGRYAIVALPAMNDPMYQRILAIRERDLLLIDTLNGHFDNYYLEMNAPYTEWRRARGIEAEALRELERQAWQQKALGVAAIVGAIALAAAGDDDTRARTDTLRDVMVVGGIYAVKQGMDKDAETGIHRAAIEELDDSFSAEARPLVVNIEGETHELTGSAEVQYAKWRGLLRQIYASETGLIQATD